MNLPDGYFLQDRKYQLSRTVGQGGFGITYLGVWNTEVKGELGAMKTKVPVCIKEYFFKDYCYRDKDNYSVMVHSETGKILFDKFKEKLIKEANILSEVHHPYIVNVLEVFEENNTAYIVMEYIKGCSLKYMLDCEDVLPENKVLKYTHQIGNALAFVHEKNIVHLDIKPSNILIDGDDNARLIDFGVSKRYDIEQQETSTTMLTLSKGFASIEQYDNEGTQSFSPCPDIYSLGATMYNLLTGVIPVESILRATKQLLKPSSYNSNITPKTEKAILKAMEIKPVDRFQSIKEMLASLDIPPYELTENTLFETKDFDDDSCTEVLNSNVSRSESKNDEDRTMLANVGSEEKLSAPKARRSVKRRVFIVASILLCAFLGYAIFDYFTDATALRGVNNAIDIPKNFAIKNTEQEKNDTLSSDTLQHQVEKTNESQTQASVKPQVVSKPESHKPEHSVDVKSQQIVAASTPVVDEKTIEKAYQELISSAKAKMEERKYSDARADLMKAMKKKSTNEAITLIQLCKEKEDEINVAQRMSQYAIFDKIEFGNLKIVRKKSNDMYGAINSKGEEIIPCQYVNVDKSVNGRAFQRKDNLFDVYNNNGECVGTGLQSFD